MNILFCYDNYFIPEAGGVERVSCVLAEAFESKGHQCYYLSLKNNSGREEEGKYVVPTNLTTKEEKAAYIAKVIVTRKITHVFNQSGSEGARGGLPELLMMVKKNHSFMLISVVHSGLFDSYRNASATYKPRFEKYGMAWMSEVLSVPLVKSLLLDYFRHKTRPFYRNLYSWSDVVVVLASEYKRDYEDLLAEKLPRVKVVPNPVTISPVAAEKKKQVLYVGRLVNSHKQVYRLLNVWKIIQAECEDWRLRIAGDGPDCRKLETQAKRQGLKRVDFLGQVRPEKEYAESPVFCMTSAFEGWSLVLTEAMVSCCVPMAFDSFGAVRDIIDDHKNGVLVKAFDEKQYATQLLKLIKDENYRQKLSSAAYKKSLNFTLSEILKVWDEILEES